MEEAYAIVCSSIEPAVYKILSDETGRAYIFETKEDALKYNGQIELEESFTGVGVRKIKIKL